MLYVATRKSMFLLLSLFDQEHLSTSGDARRLGEERAKFSRARLPLHARDCMQSRRRTVRRRLYCPRDATLLEHSMLAPTASEAASKPIEKVNHPCECPEPPGRDTEPPDWKSHTDTACLVMARFPQQRGIVSALTVGLAMATRVAAFR